MKKLSLRLTFVFMFMLGVFATVSAENKIVIEKFSIKPGMTHTFAVNLENADAMWSLQFDMQMPENLKVADVAINMERVNQGANTFSWNPDNNRVTIFNQGTSKKCYFKGNSGAIVYVTVEADNNFSKSGEIVIKEIHATDENDSRFDMAEAKAMVSPYVGNMVAVNDSIGVKPESVVRIDVALNNDIDSVHGLQTSIILPEGVEIEKDEWGDYAFTGVSDRVPFNFAFNTAEVDGKINLVISSIQAEYFKGNAGTLFSFNVKIPATIAEESEIVFTETAISNRDNVVFYMDDAKVKLTNMYVSDYKPATDSIAALDDKFAAAMATIAAEAPDFRNSEQVLADSTAIDKQIADLKAAVELAYENNTLAADMETIFAVYPEIEAAIEKMVADAKKAQDDFTTGITTVVGGKEGKVVGVYDMSGRKLSVPAKGLSIIKYSDGTVRKVNLR